MDGKKLKTREGETIRLKDLLNEAVRRAKKDLLKRLEDEDRYETEEFIANTSRIIYVTDHGQSNHFAVVFQVAKKSKWIPENCQVDHVPFGLVQGIDGKKLKTREGETIRLKDLLTEAVRRAKEDLLKRLEAVSYTHLTLPTTPYV